MSGQETRTGPAPNCICTICGTRFYRKPSQIRKWGGLYCSRACFAARGHRHGTKRCTRCKDWRPISEFGTCRANWDGLQAQCKPCHRAASAESSKRHPATGIASSRRFRQRHPEKARAHGRLRYAIRTGKLIRPNHCEDCGTEAKVHGHHDDYDKPLVVRWLCPLCHAAAHQEPAHAS